MKYHSHLALVKTRLGPTQFDVLHSEMYRLGRHTLTAYALWGLLGWAGVHQQYLGKRWKGAMYLVSVVLGVSVALAGLFSPVHLEEPYQMALYAVGALAGMVFLFLMVVDLFSLHRQVDLCNEQIEDHIIMALVDQAEAVQPEARSLGRTHARPLYFE